MSFFSRLSLAFKILFGGEVPAAAPSSLPAPTPAPQLPAPQLPASQLPAPQLHKPSAESTHASALFLLGILQREGRLIDFLQEDIAGFSDADVGAAARLVHTGCKRVVSQYVKLESIRTESEGAPIQVPAGFDANRVRLTGNVTGNGPWNGALKHHGWVAAKVDLPPLPSTVDVTVLAPAEVELS